MIAKIDPFDNDTAADWCGDLHDADPSARSAMVRAALTTAALNTGYLEHDEAVSAIAAAAIVASHMPGGDPLLVSAMRRAFGPELPWLETEALIRFELGEDVAIGDLSVRTRTSAMILTLGAYADFVERNEAEVHALLIDAERRAFDRGHHPELAE
ncbi:DUF4259 domain-containing protein [Micromonospora sp. NPDC049060]|uniref:DUF4259 domain-containing protein n=1 Tax=Micromonospora sp. NPDC049060 TaxID=3154828 RepID=UPI0033DDD9B7